MDQGFADVVLKYGFVTGLSIYGVSFLITRLLRSRTEAADANLHTVAAKSQMDVIELLTARQALLEKSLRDMWDQIESERNARVEAEDLVDKLSRRVANLEAQIRALGHEPL